MAVADLAAVPRRRVTDMKAVRTLTARELQQGLDRDSGLHVLNVQTDRFFTGELLPGSRRIPLNLLEQGTKDLSRDTEIVTYCAGPGCPQSAEAAHKLRALGFANVRVYDEGLEGWKAAGNGIVVSQPASAAG
jgi:rhodanese-related sulfurtransferase